MNQFLRSHKVVDVKRELATDGGNNCWSFCVCYIEQSQPGSRGSRVDYKDVLSEEEFVRFSEMRKLRKQMAAAENVPPYAIFTDAVLADMARLPKLTAQQMRGIDGVGEKKMEKYGEAFCRLSENMAKSDEAGKSPDGADS